MNVKDEYGLVDKFFIFGRLLKVKLGVIEFDVDGVVLGGGEVLVVGELVYFVEVNSGRFDKFECGRVGFVSGMFYGGGGDYVVVLYKGGNICFW